MTGDDIKQMYSMRDIIERYNLQVNRSGFAKCPFHNDSHPSMKIYKDSYHCFSCNSHGDIFSFVQDMDNITFKEAFLSLGGTYDDSDSYESKLALYKVKKEKERREKEQEKLRIDSLNNLYLINFYKDLIEKSEPLSTVQADAIHALSYQLYLFEYYRERRG